MSIFMCQLGRAHFCFIRRIKYIAKTGYYTQCENCNKDIYQTQTQYNRAEHHFCCNRCFKEYLHQATFENRICEYCDNSFEVRKKQVQKFCSPNCQHQWQKAQTGVLNSKFASILTHCEYCNKEKYVRPYEINMRKHNFCSNKCRQNWYSSVWSQDINWKNKSRERAIKQLQSGINVTDTKPQRIVNKMLDSMGIKYVNEYNIQYYAIDNYLSDYNLMIEVMGDYWHSNPEKYRLGNISTIQMKRLPKDKAKHTYVFNKYGIEILYLWENNIYNNEYLCSLLISEYINNNGILNNYNSFNYFESNNKLTLKGNIIQTLFEN